jgi:serine/threonine protein kinase
MNIFTDRAYEEGKAFYKYIEGTFFPLKNMIPINKGDYLGPYKLIKRIDGGVYGDVWEAIDTRPVLPPSPSPHPTATATAPSPPPSPPPHSPSPSPLPHSPLPHSPSPPPLLPPSPPPLLPPSPPPAPLLPTAPLPPRKVAIKVQCNKRNSDIESYLSAFAELECLHQFSGIENVIQLLDAFYIDSTVFFVLEYCEQTLHQLFIKMKHNSNKEQVYKLIFKQILQGLTEINRRGYMHLDIKPKNILIDSSGTVKICDFSISYRISDIKEGGEYQTSWYRSPEAINNHLNGQFFRSTYNIGYNVDVWSIGCILYEGMTSGDILFRGDDSANMYNAINKSRYYEKDNLYINKRLSQFPILVDFIKTCLIYNNSKRPMAEQLLNHDFFK